MTVMEFTSQEQFTQQVHECLSHLYDYAFLQDHPLVHLCAPEVTGPSRVQVFRDVIMESIERLRPGPEVAFHSRQARIYNILTLRYVDQQRTQDVIQQLALSERQFYREHPKAIQTLGAILWERLTGSRPVEITPISMDISVQSEVQRVFNQGERTETDLDELLIGAVAAIQSLAAQHQVTVDLIDPDEGINLEVYRSVLRQAIILILSQLLIQPNSELLTIESELVKHTCQITFTLTCQCTEPELLWTSLEKHQTLQYFVNTLEGQLIYSRGSAQQFQLMLKIPRGQQTILVVDDNPGMIDLFKRYLADKSYHLTTANEGNEAIQLARKSHPNVIVLDIMLPGQDGWEVLQSLKNHPATRTIPVLICSVLDARDLAASLGADGFLQKPPGQTELLNALVRWRD